MFYIVLYRAGSCRHLMMKCCSSLCTSMSAKCTVHTANFTIKEACTTYRETLSSLWQQRARMHRAAPTENAPYPKLRIRLVTKPSQKLEIVVMMIFRFSHAMSQKNSHSRVIIACVSCSSCGREARKSGKTSKRSKHFIRCMLSNVRQHFLCLQPSWMWNSPFFKIACSWYQLTAQVTVYLRETLISIHRTNAYQAPESFRLAHCLSKYS